MSSGEKPCLQRCIDCNMEPPDTKTSYSLIAMGWRLDRRHEDGTLVLEWRCPECWHRFKTRNVGAPPDAASSSPAPVVPAKTPGKS